MIWNREPVYALVATVRLGENRLDKAKVAYHKRDQDGRLERATVRETPLEVGANVANGFLWGYELDLRCFCDGAKRTFEEAQRRRVYEVP